LTAQHFGLTLRKHREKQRINIMLDTGVLEYFKKKASGRGYQTLINEALKRSINQEGLEKTIRRVVREELSHASR